MHEDQCGRSQLLTIRSKMCVYCVCVCARAFAFLCFFSLHFVQSQSKMRRERLRCGARRGRRDEGRKKRKQTTTECLIEKWCRFGNLNRQFIRSCLIYRLCNFIYFQSAMRDKNDDAFFVFLFVFGFFFSVAFVVVLRWVDVPWNGRLLE